MAKLPALIETLQVFHSEYDAAAIRYAARALRQSDANLLSAGAGGRGAPEMTIRDAVNLLIALNLTQTPGDYARATLLGSSLVRAPREASACLNAPSVVKEVIACETFGQALMILVERAENLAPPRVYLDPFGDPNDALPKDGRPAVLVQLTRHGNDLIARVDMFWKADKGLARIKQYYGGGQSAPRWNRWTTAGFDQALLLALKRTVVAAQPWAFEAEPGHQ